MEESVQVRSIPPNFVNWIPISLENTRQIQKQAFEISSVFTFLYNSTERSIKNENNIDNKRINDFRKNLTDLNKLKNVIKDRISEFQHYFITHGGEIDDRGIELENARVSLRKALNVCDLNLLEQLLDQKTNNSEQQLQIEINIKNDSFLNQKSNSNPNQYYSHEALYNQLTNTKRMESNAQHQMIQMEELKNLQNQLEERMKRLQSIYPQPQITNSTKNQVLLTEKTLINPYNSGNENKTVNQTLNPSYIQEKPEVEAPKHSSIHDVNYKRISSSPNKLKKYEIVNDHNNSFTELFPYDDNETYNIHFHTGKMDTKVDPLPNSFKDPYSKPEDFFLDINNSKLDAWKSEPGEDILKEKKYKSPSRKIKKSISQSSPIKYSSRSKSRSKSLSSSSQNQLRSKSRDNSKSKSRSKSRDKSRSKSRDKSRSKSRGKLRNSKNISDISDITSKRSPSKKIQKAHVKRSSISPIKSSKIKEIKSESHFSIPNPIPREYIPSPQPKSPRYSFIVPCEPNQNASEIEIETIPLEQEAFIENLSSIEKIDTSIQTESKSSIKKIIKLQSKENSGKSSSKSEISSKSISEISNQNSTTEKLKKKTKSSKEKKSNDHIPALNPKSKNEDKEKNEISSTNKAQNELPFEIILQDENHVVREPLSLKIIQRRLEQDKILIKDLSQNESTQESSQPSIASKERNSKSPLRSRSSSINSKKQNVDSKKNYQDIYIDSQYQNDESFNTSKQHSIRDISQNIHSIEGSPSLSVRKSKTPLKSSRIPYVRSKDLKNVRIKPIYNWEKKNLDPTQIYQPTSNSELNSSKTQKVIDSFINTSFNNNSVFQDSTEPIISFRLDPSDFEKLMNQRRNSLGSIEQKKEFLRKGYGRLAFESAYNKRIIFNRINGLPEEINLTKYPISELDSLYITSKGPYIEPSDFIHAHSPKKDQWVSNQEFKTALKPNELFPPNSTLPNFLNTGLIYEKNLYPIRQSDPSKRIGEKDFILAIKTPDSSQVEKQYGMGVIPI